jgi:hypothetical protein
MKTKTTRAATKGRRVVTPARGWVALRRAVDVNLAKEKVEPANRWQDLGDDGIWRLTVGQVAVIGRSKPWDTIKASWRGSGLEYADASLVVAAGRVADIAALLQHHFAKAGVRYAGKGRAPSRKAEACARNLVRLRALGGPTRFAEILAAIADENERAELTRALLAEVGPKGARDLLMGLGLHRNSIALDARVMSALRAAGVTTAKKAPADRKAYQLLERQLIDEVATPLGVEPIVVDRTLYWRSKEVLAALTGVGQ